MISPSRKILTLVIVTSAVALFGACAGSPTKDSTGQYIDDSTITTKVKAALLGDSMVKSFEIHVITFKGVVQLSGFVDTADQRDAAVHDASAVPGVSSVQNNITLKQ
jgi:osmotically-inducible protein OsmY